MPIQHDAKGRFAPASAGGGGVVGKLGAAVGKKMGVIQTGNKPYLKRAMKSPHVQSLYRGERKRIGSAIARGHERVTSHAKAGSGRAAAPNVAGHLSAGAGGRAISRRGAGAASSVRAPKVSTRITSSSTVRTTRTRR